MKVFLLVAVIALVSGASALKWRQCEPLRTKIKSVSVPDCDPKHSTPGLCALTMLQAHRIYVNYVQPKPIKVPNIRLDFFYKNEEYVGCGEGLVCPGAAGQEQHLNSFHFFSPRPTGLSDDIMRLTVRENGLDVDQADLCIEIPFRAINATYV